MTDFLTSFGVEPEPPEGSAHVDYEQAGGTDFTDNPLIDSREPLPIPIERIAPAPIPIPANGPVVPIPVRNDPCDAWFARQVIIPAGRAIELEGANQLRRRIVVNVVDDGDVIQLGSDENEAQAGFPLDATMPPLELHTVGAVYAYAVDTDARVAWLIERDNDHTADRLV